MKITLADFHPCLADFFCSVNGVNDRQRKGAVKQEENRRSVARLARVLADVFQKKEKKNKTTSVYRLMIMFKQ